MSIENHCFYSALAWMSTTIVDFYYKFVSFALKLSKTKRKASRLMQALALINEKCNCITLSTAAMSGGLLVLSKNVLLSLESL